MALDEIQHHLRRPVIDQRGYPDIGVHPAVMPKASALGRAMACACCQCCSDARRFSPSRRTPLTLRFVFLARRSATFRSAGDSITLNIAGCASETTPHI